MSGLSNIACSLVVFFTSQIAALPLSKLCYLTDITSGPSRVITSGECGLKCGSKEGCMTFITCDLAYSKTCTIYKIASKETCGEKGVDCSYFVQVTTYFLIYRINPFFLFRMFADSKRSHIIFFSLNIAENRSFGLR